MGQHQGGHDIHGRLHHGPWPAGHADRASGQDRRRLAGGAHSPRQVGERLGHHGDHDPAVHSQIGQRAEPEQRTTSVDPSLGHGQHPRQRGHDDRHEGEVHVVLCFLPPRSAASLHSRDELFAKHIEPEPAPEDPVDWAMEEAYDEDDAPMPDLIDMPPAPASARPMSNLEHCIALRLVATRRKPIDQKKKQKMPLHHITSSLCCLRCAVCRVSLLSCPLVSCPGTQTVTNLVFFFSVASKRVLTQGDFCASANSNKRGCGPPVKAQATARVDVPQPACFPHGPRSPTRVQVFVTNAWICAQRATDRDLESSSTRRR